MSSRMSKQSFHDRYGPWALVFGAAHGIGRAYCFELTRRGLNLVLVDKDADGLDKLSEALRKPGIWTKTIVLDLAKPDSHLDLAASTKDLDLGLLIFNAAHSVVGPFLETSIEEHLLTVDVNARSVLANLRMLLPQLVARGRGGLLIMTSLAGLGGTAQVASYAASKAFDLVLAESLWAELAPTGVHVLALVAGPTDTPGFQTSRPKMSPHLVMRPEEVATQALDHLHQGPVFVPGKLNRLTATLRQHILPRRLAATWMAHAMTSVYPKQP